MTGASVAAPRQGLAAPLRAATPGRRSATIELAAFVSFTVLVLALWSRLVADPDLIRLVAVAAIVMTTAALLAALRRRRPSRPAADLAALVISLAGLSAALVAAGLEVRLLAPANWDALADGLAVGVQGIEHADLPYRDSDLWVALTLELIAPALLGLAAAVAFWPGTGRRRPLVALAILVAAYGIAATLDSPPAEPLWGIVVLLLIAAWLWLPALGRSALATGATLLALGAAVALPVAAVVDPGKPWWDYQSWSWFGAERQVSFEWDHSYGPLDWPQDGTAVLEVRSERPLYWKVSVLDRFDGFTWARAPDGDYLAAREREARDLIPGTDLPERRAEWLTTAEVETKALSSSFVPVAGTTQDVEGLVGAGPAEDGSVRRYGAPVTEDTSYSLVTYAPDPTPAQLRRASGDYPAPVRSQVLLGLPPATAAADTSVGGDASEPVAGTPMALWADPHPRVRERILDSAYADVYALARRVVAGADTPYEATIAIQRHLQRGYAYNPDVGREPYPLRAFLFDQREGYCQQFSGAMALMLRLVGIPSRVVTGFAPGTLDPDAGVYTVRDTDAHSWVEVYFRGIGWVTFDPTPAAAPAASQALSADIAALQGDAPPAPGADSRFDDANQADRTPATGGGGDEGSGAPWSAILLGAGAFLLGVLAFSAWVAWRRRERLQSGVAAEDQLAELVEALRRLNWRLPPRATLLALQRRFDAARRPAVAEYLAGLRAHRFAAVAAPPGPRQRRELRRALGASEGLGRRLRAWRAIPPGGPARRRRR